jgi:hypothetical protein
MLSILAAPQGVGSCARQHSLPALRIASGGVADAKSNHLIPAFKRLFQLSGQRFRSDHELHQQSISFLGFCLWQGLPAV